MLGEREPFYSSAAKIAMLADKGKVQLVVSASTVYYILSGFEDKELVKEKIRKFKVIADTSVLTDKVIEKGLSSKFSDFENSLHYYCAIQKECKILITRNLKDFKIQKFQFYHPMNT